jgi:two-component system cell cycle sensor histidine kinase/response regulator CckA
MSPTPATILVVEDNRAFRQMTVKVLELSGYRVVSAGSAAQALAAVEGQEGPLDLLVTDLVMTEGNGLSLADALAALHPRLRVLFMSGYGAEVAGLAGLAGADRAFLEKPFTPAGLEEAVRGLLAGP